MDNALHLLLLIQDNIYIYVQFMTLFTFDLNAIGSGKTGSDIFYFSTLTGFLEKLMDKRVVRNGCCCFPVSKKTQPLVYLGWFFKVTAGLIAA